MPAGLGSAFEKRLSDRRKKEPLKKLSALENNYQKILYDEQRSRQLGVSVDSILKQKRKSIFQRLVEKFRGKK